MAKVQKTNKELAIKLFVTEAGKGRTRQQILAKMQTKLNMTPACARNYYQRINSGTWPTETA